MNSAMVLALLAGVAIALQLALMSVAQRTLGPVFLVAISGITTGVGAGIIALFTPRPEFSARIVGYAIASGLLGAFIVGATSVAAGQGGISRTLSLVIASQLLVGILADKIGLFGTELQTFGWAKVFGMLLILVGGIILIRD